MNKHEYLMMMEQQKIIEKTINQQILLELIENKKTTYLTT